MSLRPIVVADEVIDAAEAVLAAAQVLVPRALLHQALQAAFRSSGVHVTAETVKIVDTRPPGPAE